MKHWSSMSAHFLKYAMWAGLYQRTSFIVALKMSLLEGTKTQSASSLNLTECLGLFSVLIRVDDRLGDLRIPSVPVDSSSVGMLRVRSILAMKTTRWLRRAVPECRAGNALRLAEDRVDEGCGCGRGSPQFTQQRAPSKARGSLRPPHVDLTAVFCCYLLLQCCDDATATAAADIW